MEDSAPPVCPYTKYTPNRSKSNGLGIWSGLFPAGDAHGGIRHAVVGISRLVAVVVVTAHEWRAVFHEAYNRVEGIAPVDLLHPDPIACRQLGRATTFESSNPPRRSSSGMDSSNARSILSKQYSS